jgi:hypothetical protein
MHIIVRLFIAALAVALLVPATASAAPIKECGNRAAGEGWTYDEISGAGIYNVTSRIASCRAARRVVSAVHRSWERDPAEPILPRRVTVFNYRYTCRFLTRAEELYDIRCTARKGRVVRWQEGS